MEAILNDIVDPSDLKKVRLLYEDQQSHKVTSEKAQFEYAIALVRCRTDVDIKHGVALLEDLFKRTHDTSFKKDCLYYLALAYTRMKKYEKALTYTESFLKIEPKNHQVQDLQKYIKKKITHDGLAGMAIVGGAVLVLGALVGLGIAVVKK